MTAENRIISIWCGQPGDTIESGTMVDVHATPVTEHIAVHPTIGGDPAAAVRWTVTHIPTGLRMCAAPTKAVATAAASAFSRLPVDWSAFTLDAARTMPEGLAKDIGSIKYMALFGKLNALEEAHR
ncbi:hypothetical protein L3067_01290 [Xanthomonas sp. PPL568]|uniref:hypothetical protein n=1 Tax=Xanthomonas indica TaxID=2912242 RepID=UPI001F55C243|nr:hypothetical protein [Xanthomonas indica]MCI2243243.1 hypothetical protein [Xanthomonas indica]